jgi:hypothetical protein
VRDNCVASYDHEESAALGTTTWTRSPGVEFVKGGRTALRRPWWIWGIPFASLFCVLVARNAFLFSTRLYEQGDSGDDSILIEQALRFRLLVGNYSREGFNHPGPAYMYIQAFGEWVAYRLLHVVPTPWNGQLLAVLALNSAFAALTVGIVYGWTHSVRGAVAAFVVILGFATVHPPVFTSGWMPDLYIMPFFVFLLAAASASWNRGRGIRIGHRWLASPCPYPDWRRCHIDATATGVDAP